MNDPPIPLISQFEQPSTEMDVFVLDVLDVLDADVSDAESGSTAAAAAGVLPIFFVDGETYLFLGRESYRHLFPSSLLLCDFGGSKKVKKSLFDCACEEFVQESLGCFFSHGINTPMREVSLFIRRNTVAKLRCLPKRRNAHNAQTSTAPASHQHQMRAVALPKPYELYVVLVTADQVKHAFVKFEQSRKDLLSGKLNGKFLTMSARALKDYCEKDVLCGVKYDLAQLYFAQNLYRPEFWQVITSEPFQCVIQEIEQKTGKTGKTGEK